MSRAFAQTVWNEWRNEWQDRVGREMVGWRGAVLVDDKKGKYIFFFRFLTSTTGTGIAFLPSYLRDKNEA